MSSSQSPTRPLHPIFGSSPTYAVPSASQLPTRRAADAAPASQLLKQQQSIGYEAGPSRPRANGSRVIGRSAGSKGASKEEAILVVSDTDSENEMARATLHRTELGSSLTQRPRQPLPKQRPRQISSSNHAPQSSATQKPPTPGTKAISALSSDESDFCIIEEKSAPSRLSAVSRRTLPALNGLKSQPTPNGSSGSKLPVSALLPDHGEGRSDASESVNAATSPGPDRIHRRPEHKSTRDDFAPPLASQRDGKPITSPNRHPRMRQHTGLRAFASAASALAHARAPAATPNTARASAAPAPEKREASSSGPLSRPEGAALNPADEKHRRQYAQIAGTSSASQTPSFNIGNGRTAEERRAALSSTASSPSLLARGASQMSGRPSLSPVKRSSDSTYAVRPPNAMAGPSTYRQLLPDPRRATDVSRKLHSPSTHAEGASTYDRELDRQPARNQSEIPSPRNSRPPSASTPYSAPLHRTISNLSSTSSHSDSTWASTPRSQERQERLDAMRAAGRRTAEKALPVSNIDVQPRRTASPMGKKRKRDSTTSLRTASPSGSARGMAPKDGSGVKKEKHRRTLSSKTLLGVETGLASRSTSATPSGLSARARVQTSRNAIVDSPLKHAMRMSSPASATSYGRHRGEMREGSDDPDADPLDSRQRRGKRRGVDLVEEMRKSSPSYRAGDMDMDEDTDMDREEQDDYDRRAASATPPADALITPGVAVTEHGAPGFSETAMAVDDDMDDFEALLAEFGDVDVPAEIAAPEVHTTTVTAPTLPLSGPTALSAASASQSKLPSTPSRHGPHLDASKTHAEGATSRSAAISPSAQRFLRHATLSPSASLVGLGAGAGPSRNRRPSSTRSHRSPASLDSVPSRMPPRESGPSDGGFTAGHSGPAGALRASNEQMPKERSLADILREQREEAERAERADDEEIRHQAERWDALERGDEYDLDSAEAAAVVPQAEAAQGAEKAGDVADSREGRVRRTSDRLKGRDTQGLPKATELPALLPSEAEPLDLKSAEKTSITSAAVVYPSALETEKIQRVEEGTAANGVEAMAGLLGDGEAATTGVDTLREIAQGASEEDEHWQGVWQSAAWVPDEDVLKRKVAVVTEIEGCGWLGPALEMAADGHVTTLLTLLASGICTDALDAHDGVGPCEVLQMVIDTALSDAEEAPLALSAALSMISSTNTNPFGSSRGLMGKIAYTITSFGIRPDMRPLFPAHECPDDACDAGCGWRIGDRNRGLGVMAWVVAKSAECGWIEKEHAVQIAKLSLFLAIDPHTRPDTVDVLRKALHELYPLCLECLSAPGLAIEICGLAVELPYLAQRELLGVIGSKSWQALEIVRWVGMGLLVPGCLEDLSPRTVHVKPPVQWLKRGSNRINDNVVDKDHITDQSMLSTQIDAFCAALNDLQQMVLLTQGKTSHVKAIFVAICKDLLRASEHILSTTNMGISNKMRLHQLATLIDIQIEKPLIKRKMQKQQSRLSKGLVLGEDGKGGNQTKLDFARLPKSDGDTGGKEDEVTRGDGGSHAEPGAGDRDGVDPADVGSADEEMDGADETEGISADPRALIDIPQAPQATGGSGGAEDKLLTSETLPHESAAAEPLTVEAMTSAMTPPIDALHTGVTPLSAFNSTTLSSDRFYTPPASAPASSPASPVQLAEGHRDGETAATERYQPGTPPRSVSPRAGKFASPNHTSPPRRRSRSTSVSLMARVKDAARSVARKAGFNRVLSPNKATTSMPGLQEENLRLKSPPLVMNRVGSATIRTTKPPPLTLGDVPAGARRTPSDPLTPSFGSAVVNGKLEVAASGMGVLRLGFGPKV